MAPRVRTHEMHVSNIRGMGVEAIELYRGSHTKTLHKCIECGNEWLVKPVSIHTGCCPKCAMDRRAALMALSQKEYAVRCKDVNVKPIGKYVNRLTELRHQCMVCDHKWSVQPASVLTGRGCPECGKAKVAEHTEGLKLCHKEYLQRIKEKGFRLKPLDKYVRSKDSLRHECLVCNNVWSSTPNMILSGRGCSVCSKGHKTITIEGVEFTKLSGYEPAAIKWMVRNRLVKARELLGGTRNPRVPTIEYTLHDGTHQHYPDFFIHSQNRVVEVKSVWTLCSTKLRWDTIKAKREGAMAMGYEYTVLVMNANGTRRKLPENWWKLSHRKFTQGQNRQP